MNTTSQEKAVKELFIGNCWNYLYNNFHKFNETNKIKIALDICKKNIPQELEHSGEVNITVTEKITSARERVLSAISTN